MSNSKFRIVLEVQLADKAKTSPYDFKTLKDVVDAEKRGEIRSGKVTQVGGAE